MQYAQALGSGQSYPATPSTAAIETLSAVLDGALATLVENEKGMAELLSRLGALPPPSLPVPEKIGPAGFAGRCLDVRSTALRLSNQITSALQHIG